MYSYAMKVDIGVSEKQNDDRALLSDIILMGSCLSGKLEKDYVIAAVCDGVGGLEQGYRAAMCCLERISHLNKADISKEEIHEAMEEANVRIRNRQSMEKLHRGMMTTVAGIYANAEKFFVFNAGDSRVYRFRYKYLMQLSKDHSLVQDMMDMGEITPEEARHHEKKNVINKCIGLEEVVNARIIEDEDYTEGDIILICSDGISDVLCETELKEIFFEYGEEENLNTCCEKIVEKALQNGTQDNMSVILLRKE